MGHIRKERLNTRFFITDASITVGDVARAWRQIPKPRRMAWQAVVSLGRGEIAVVTAASLGAVAERGADVLARPLFEVEGLLEPSLTVERMAQGIGEARKVMRRSPGRRLVVLEGGTVVGLLSEEARLGGFPTELPQIRPQELFNLAVPIKCRCPQCGTEYDFAELLQPGTNRLVCPRGHVIEEGESGS